MITRQGIRRLLEAEGDIDIVGEAADGGQAVDLAIEKKPDVIIMDIAMPKLNGVEATRRIKALCPTIAVLILSSYDDDEYVFGLLDIGVAGYLLKTATGDELINAIVAVNNGESVLDNAITSKLIDRFKAPGAVALDVESYESLNIPEIQVLKLAARGRSNKEMAFDLAISKRSIERYMRSIFHKLDVGSRTEAVIYGLKKGWFELDDIL
jgi:DNA-binding NarL/FixJ family response regulator